MSEKAENPIPQLGDLALDGKADGAKATDSKGKELNLEAEPKEHGQGVPERSDETSSPLQLVLCRFEERKLMRQVNALESTEFLAISHVWGEADWTEIAGVEGEVLVSLEKAKFIEEQLPSIVGSQWFWMDVLCIDQRDKAARVAITQHIPSVFRLAQRTIAVRGSSGFKECCIEAMGDVHNFFSKSRDWRSTREDESDIDFSDGPDGRRLLGQHIADEHAGQVMREGLLTRLWPFQEIILSDEIQFARCEAVEGAEKPRATTEYEAKEMPVLSSSLSALAITWSTHGTALDQPMRYRTGFTKNDLVSAFLNLGTASRPEKNREVLLPSERDIMIHLQSTRDTSKPRDFILAIMPQYGFYKAPKNAKQLTFTELFVDCSRQLREAGSSLSPLFLESEHILDGRVGPLKVDVPEPKCLGDLVRLFGGPALRAPEGSKIDLQQVVPIPMAKVIASASQMLSDDPENLTENDIRLANTVVVIHTVVRSIFNSTTLWPICHHEMNRELAALPADAKEKRNAIEALHMMLSNINLNEDSYVNAVRMTNYAELRQLLREVPWEISITLAAMISCGLGISGLDWALQNQCPLRVDVNQVSYLALAPNSIALHKETGYYLKAGGEFHGGRDGPLPRIALLATNSETEGFFTLCMFPPDSKFKASRHY